MSPQDIGGIHPTAMNHPNEKIPAVHVNRHILEIHMKAVLFAKNNPHSLSVGIGLFGFRLGYPLFLIRSRTYKLARTTEIKKKKMMSADESRKL